MPFSFAFIKRCVGLLSGIIAVAMCILKVFFLLPIRIQTLIRAQGINMFGHQLGWQLGRLFLRNIYHSSATEWPLYCVLYCLLPLGALIVAQNPKLQSLGLGRSVAGFASIGVWILMERLLEVRAKPKQWARYFSFYIVFYHLSGLMTQATFGTSLFAYRHAWASMVGFLWLTTILPRFLLWSEGVEIERISLFHRFLHRSKNYYSSWVKSVHPQSTSSFKDLSLLCVCADSHDRQKQLTRLGKKIINWPYFNRIVIGIAGVILGCLSATYPIYLQMCRTSCALPFSFSVGLLALIIGNILGFFIRPFFIRLSPLTRLKIDLLCMAISVVTFLKICWPYEFACNLIFLGCICYMLYPDLIARMQQWSQTRCLSEVRQKIENCFQYANYVFSVFSLCDRLVSDLRNAGAKQSIDDFFYYFLNGYLFLFCFALIPDKADQFVAQGKVKMGGWIKEKQKTVAKKVLAKIQLIEKKESEVEQIDPLSKSKNNLKCFIDR